MRELKDQGHEACGYGVFSFFNGERQEHGLDAGSPLPVVARDALAKEGITAPSEADIRLSLFGVVVMIRPDVNCGEGAEVLRVAKLEILGSDESEADRWVVPDMGWVRLKSCDEPA